MKKLASLLGFLAIAFIMTSCLGEVDGSFSMDRNLSYIKTTTDGQKYARTHSGYWVTAPEYQKFEPGVFIFSSFSWQETQGMKETDMGVPIYNVTVREVSEPIKRTGLKSTPAPEGKTTVPFVTFNNPIYDQGTYYDDYWVFPFSYKKKEGEDYSVVFYLAVSERSDFGEKVTVDVRLEKTGTTTGTKEEVKPDLVAVDLSPIRAKYSGTNASSTKQVFINFRYFVENEETPVRTNDFMMVVQGN